VDELLVAVRCFNWFSLFSKIPCVLLVNRWIAVGKGYPRFSDTLNSN